MASQVPKISFEEYAKNLTLHPAVINGQQIKQDAEERHHRILNCIVTQSISGPTLDAACGSAIFYPSLLKYMPQMMPYSVSDLVEHDIVYGGQKIECHRFECEKTILPVPDQSMGCVMFCDVIEHLLVDPIWTILEFNRVLRKGGHLIISTPNACHLRRVIHLLHGLNSATENHYKPTSLYQRHNREWTVDEINTLMAVSGFEPVVYSTHHYLLNDVERALFSLFQETKLVKYDQNYYGPEIFYLAKKSKHKTLESVTDIDERWPSWLYTHHSTYRRRPEVFPVILGKDYG